MTVNRIESAPFYWEQGGGVKSDAATGYCNGWNDCIAAHMPATNTAATGPGEYDLDFIVSQALLDWNRALPDPVIRIGYEYVVAAECLRLITKETNTAATGMGDALTLSAPPQVWLQIDTDGDAEDRSETIRRENWGDLTWHHESIGGQEVVYIRHDLAAQPAPVVGDDLRDVRELLAVMHGDGGHYCAEHGIAKASCDALEKYNSIRKLLAAHPAREGDGRLIAAYLNNESVLWQYLRHLESSNPTQGTRPRMCDVRAALAALLSAVSVYAADPLLAARPGGEDRRVFIEGYMEAAHRHAHGSTPISAIEHHARLAADKAGYLAHPAQAGGGRE